MANSQGECIALTISADHPSLPGHFPGNPIVPGVVILDTVVEALKKRYPDTTFCGVRKMKFLRPLAAGQVFELQPSSPSPNSLRFKCRLQEDGELLAEGNLLLGAVAPTESPVA